MKSKKPSEEDNSRLEWQVEPFMDIKSGGTRHIWMSKEGLSFRYAVHRVESSAYDKPHFGAERKVPVGWDIFEHHKDGTGYPKYYSSLEDALISVETFHARKYGSVSSNREEVLAHAHKVGLDGIKRKGETRTAHNEGRETRVSKPRGNNTMSCVDAAFKVLSEEGRTLNAKEMITLMDERGYWSSAKGATPWATLGSALGVAIRAGDTRFKSEGKGNFSLNK